MDYFTFASQNARSEFGTRTMSDDEMRAIFKKNQPKPVYCPYCLFMRDLSVKLQADGSCAVCARGGRNG